MHWFSFTNCVPTTTYMCQWPREAVVCLLGLPCLPIALPQRVPGVNLGGVVLDGTWQVILCFLAVLWEDIEGTPLQAPELHLRNAPYCNKVTWLHHSWQIVSEWSTSFSTDFFFPPWISILQWFCWHNCYTIHLHSNSSNFGSISSKNLWHCHMVSPWSKQCKPSIGNYYL